MLVVMVLILFAGFWYHVGYAGGANQSFVESNWFHFGIGIFMGLTYLILKTMLLHIEISNSLKKLQKATSKDKSAAKVNSNG